MKKGGMKQVDLRGVGRWAGANVIKYIMCVHEILNNENVVCLLKVRYQEVSEKCKLKS